MGNPFPPPVHADRGSHFPERLRERGPFDNLVLRFGGQSFSRCDLPLCSRRAGPAGLPPQCSLKAHYIRSLAPSGS